MDYRMMSILANPDENVVKIISDKLKEQGYRHSDLTLQFVGFEAAAGTAFYLNDQKDVMRVPTSGRFISPFNGERYMKIKNLTFPAGFVGDIYYII